MPDYGNPFSTEKDKQIQNAIDSVKKFFTPPKTVPNPNTLSSGVSPMGKNLIGNDVGYPAGGGVGGTAPIKVGADITNPTAKTTVVKDLQGNVITMPSAGADSPSELKAAAGTTAQIFKQNTGVGAKMVTPVAAPVDPADPKSIFAGIDTTNDAARQAAVQTAMAKGHVFKNEDLEALYPGGAKPSMSDEDYAMVKARGEENMRQANKTLTEANLKDVRDAVSRIAGGQVKDKKGIMAQLANAFTSYLSTMNPGDLTKALQQATLEETKAKTGQYSANAEYITGAKTENAAAAAAAKTAKIDDTTAVEKSVRDEAIKLVSANPELSYAEAVQQVRQTLPGADQTNVAPPVPGAKKAKDGKWYVPDPARKGKYLMVGMQ